MYEKTLEPLFPHVLKGVRRRCDSFSKDDRYLDWMKYELADMYYQQDDSQLQRKSHFLDGSIHTDSKFYGRQVTRKPRHSG